MTIQYLYGDTNPNLLTVATSQAVSVGDLVAYEGNTLIRAQDEAWAAAIATPAAPTLTATVTAIGTPLTAAATRVKISLQFPWGEGPASLPASVTPTAGGLILCAMPASLPVPALWYNIYVETAAGSGIYALWGLSTGQTVLIGSYGGGPAPTASPVLSDSTTLTQYNFLRTFAGVSSQTKAANSTTAWGNSVPNQVRVDAEGCFRIDVAAGPWPAGTLVGPSKSSGANSLNSQAVAPVVHQSLACGTIVEDVPAGATQAKVRIYSALLSTSREILPGGGLPPTL